jgi:hypothetical protein
MSAGLLSQAQNVRDDLGGLVGVEPQVGHGVMGMREQKVQRRLGRRGILRKLEEGRRQLPGSSRSYSMAARAIGSRDPLASLDVDLGTCGGRPREPDSRRDRDDDLRSSAGG